jgi:ABC-type phosphate transport system permease subunit
MSQPGAPQEKLGVVSVILGVVALVTSWVLIGIAFGIAAIVTGTMGYSRAKHAATSSRVATTGIVLGVVSILAGLIAMACYFWYWGHQDQPVHRCKAYDTYQPC